MEDFNDSMSFDLKGKTRYAMIAFLRKHGGDTEDLSRFIESAVIWRMVEREMAFRHAKQGDAVGIFSGGPYAEPATVNANRAMLAVGDMH